MAKDTKMYYLEDDIQKIQVKTNMYINEYGKAGAFHLAREVIQNNFDECLDEDSPGKTIEISYDRETDILRSEDDGRGFDERDYPMNIFCTTLQSGSKFFRSSGAASAGEFGVGLTTVNALSDMFTLTSYREVEGTVHKIEFSEGTLKKDTKKKNTTSKKHGVIVEFRVSKKYMGDEAELPIDEVISWIDSLFYLNSDRLKKHKITCVVSIYNGITLEKTHKFKPQEFSALLDKMIPAHVKKKQMAAVCNFSGETLFTEDSKTLVENKDGSTSVESVLEEKEIHMDVALRYSIAADMNGTAIYDTYCNYTNTIENGVHLVAFEEAYCRFMQTKVNATMSDAQKDKMKITWDDIRTNLFAVINLTTNAYVGFVGNAKTKIDNKELIPYIKDIIATKLEEFFGSNSTLLNEYIKIIKLNAKARIEAQKVKTASQTERMNSFKEHKLHSFCAL